MAGNSTNGLPLVAPDIINGTTQTAPNGTYQHLGGREQIAADTQAASGAPPQSVAAQAVLIAGLATSMIQNRVTLSSNAATLNTTRGMITTESLSTAAGATQKITLTNSAVLATSTVIIDVHNGTNTGGAPQISDIEAASGSFVATIQNYGSTAFNGPLVLPFQV